jgi:hypothetical protein
MQPSREVSAPSGSHGSRRLRNRGSQLARHAIGSLAMLGLAAACSLSLDQFDNGVCPPEQKVCPNTAGSGRVCVSVNDPDHSCNEPSPQCGPCNVAGAAPVCTNGVCSIGQCMPGLQDCNHDNRDGCEADTNNETHNCGACGTVCTLPAGAGPHVVPVCNSGSCHTGCAPGYPSCPGPSTTCPDIQNDPMNCGGCNKPCNGGSCVMGTCVVDGGTD